MTTEKFLYYILIFFFHKLNKVCHIQTNLYVPIQYTNVDSIIQICNIKLSKIYIKTKNTHTRIREQTWLDKWKRQNLFISLIISWLFYFFVFDDWHKSLSSRRIVYNHENKWKQKKTKSYIWTNNWTKTNIINILKKEFIKIRKIKKRN